MRKLSVFGAAALLASAVALPSMAQAAGCAKSDPACSSMRKETGATRSTRAEVKTEVGRSGRQHRSHSASRNERIDQRRAANGRYGNGYYASGEARSGFWPGDVVGGAVGTATGIAAGAVNTAGAIATAPFRGPDSYAYDNHGYYNNGYYGPGTQSYAERNGFVCTPGTYFKGEDGRRHLCQ
jgi:hypothetical protein